MNAQPLLVDSDAVSRRRQAPGRRHRVNGDRGGGSSDSTRQRILDYLAKQGGSVESADGRGLTRRMAQAVGYDDLSTLNAMLTRLEREGAIVREVRGRRTYRIAVAPGASERGGKRGPGDTLKSEAELEDELCHPRAQLRFCLLLLVGERPGHGYDLVDRLRPFGYEHDDPAQTYRALHWLEGAGLVSPVWETEGPGPARRVFSVTDAGRRMVESCKPRILQRVRSLEAHLDSEAGEPLEAMAEPQSRFEVLVEAKLAVDAADEAMARRKVEKALARRRPVDTGVRGTGQVWLYEATPEDEA